jgi:hypothetical protein
MHTSAPSANIDHDELLLDLLATGGDFGLEVLRQDVEQRLEVESVWRSATRLTPQEPLALQLPRDIASILRPRGATHQAP